MKLQQVEWFAARRPEIARARRAADRKRMIRALRDDGDPLAANFEQANERVDSALRVARIGGSYPWLSRGDVNLYSLFVERAMALVGPQGVVGLLTPSGIASDKTAAPFFRSVATEGRLRALYDFENRRTRYDLPAFFPDVDSRFKFCAFVAGRSPTAGPAHCAFFLQDIAELQDPDHRFPLEAADFATVNPNTGTAPIFRTRRDAELTTAIYRRLPVLVDRSSGEEVRSWPVKYATMFHMTNDSDQFRTREELEEQEGAWPIGGNRFDSAAGEWVPLYEGKMVQAFDHRAARIVVNPENLHRPAQPLSTTPEQHRNLDWLPDPQYWVAASACGWPPEYGWVLGFKEITAPTNVRTFIAALLPTVGFGNKVPILRPETADRQDEDTRELDEPALSGGHSNEQISTAPRTYPTGGCPDRREWLLAANLNATIFDFVTRQKVQGQTLNLFIVEQLPVIPPDRYESVRFGPRTAADVVRNAVLELTYTAHDMAPFARDLGYVDEAGAVRSPFRWDEERRLRLRAKLDAVFFPSLRSHRSGGCPLRVLHLPHRRAAGDRDSRSLPLTRPVPRLPERPCCRPAGCGPRHMTFHYSSLRGSRAPRCSTIPTTCRLSPSSGPAAASAEGSFAAERTTVQVASGAVWLHDGSTGTWTRGFRRRCGVAGARQSPTLE